MQIISFIYMVLFLLILFLALFLFCQVYHWIKHLLFKNELNVSPGSFIDISLGFLSNNIPKHFSKNFKYLIKNHLKNNNLNYEIRKEIYFYLKNNDKNNNFEGFYQFIKNKYSEENIVKIPEQKIA